MNYLPPELEVVVKERTSWIERPTAAHYKKLIENLPDIQASKISYNSDAIVIGDSKEVSDQQKEVIIKAAKDLIPWRKGPFNLFGTEINSEWQSNLKWNRIEKFIPSLEGKKILDIGCSNGYYMFRLAAHNPKLILGIDPVLHVQTQFKFFQHFIKNPALNFELLGIEHVGYFKEYFDLILSMGIIYHHRNPIEQLLAIRHALKPKGQVILETIGIPGKESTALFPKDRYANMRNVWFIPTLNAFINWAHKAKFTDIEVISDTLLTADEQRLTPWCPPPHQSLEDFLDPKNPDLTIEGHPAPRRFAIIARKKG